MTRYKLSKKSAIKLRGMRELYGYDGQIMNARVDRGLIKVLNITDCRETLVSTTIYSKNNAKALILPCLREDEAKSTESLAKAGKVKFVDLEKEMKDDYGMVIIPKGWKTTTLGLSLCVSHLLGEVTEGRVIDIVKEQGLKAISGRPIKHTGVDGIESFEETLDNIICYLEDGDNNHAHRYLAFIKKILERELH